MPRAKVPQITDVEIDLAIEQGSADPDEAPRATEDLHLERGDRALERLENYFEMGSAG
jgi:hypothetical protein